MRNPLLQKLKFFVKGFIGILICLIFVLSFPVTIIGSSGAKVQFTADTIVNLSGIANGDLYIATDSEADSISVSGSTLSVNNIPDGSSFILKTPQHDNALKITPSGGTINLTFDSSNLSSGNITQWTASGSGSIQANLIVGTPKTNSNYTVKVDGTIQNTYLSNSSGEITFNYSGNNSTHTFVVEEGSSNPVSSVINAIQNIFSPASAPSCGKTPPSNNPQQLYAAIPQNGNSIMLYFTDANTSSYDHYAVTYGLSAGNYSFGLDNAGGKGIRTVLINSLIPNTTYYFKIRPGNGCAPGVWSNEISAKTKGLISFNQLDITQSELESKPIEETPPAAASCKTYTVKSGDTLWSIAENLLGGGNRYKEIIEQNNDKYPSLETSNSISTGWELKVNCWKQISTGGTQKALAQGGYDVKVKVVDTNKKPAQGAKVTIHSKVQETITNKDGIAQFKNVEAGNHKVLTLKLRNRLTQNYNKKPMHNKYYQDK